MSFHVIAPIYDRINGDQYPRYAAYLEEAFKTYATLPIEQVLDIGCGTGKITSLLAAAGYDMTGLDNSCEMLNLARENNSGNGTLLLMQDMRRMDLFGTVQAAYCAFDGLNYLSTVADLKKTFARVSLFLEPGGLFLFDLNTKERLSRYAESEFSYEFPDGLLLWRNEQSGEKTRFLLDWFALADDGVTYTRHSEEMTERPFAEQTVRDVANETGLSVLRCFTTAEDHPIPDALPETDAPPAGEAAKQFFILRKRGEAPQ